MQEKIGIGTEGQMGNSICSIYKQKGVASKGHPIWCRISDQLFPAQLQRHQGLIIIQEIKMSRLPGGSGKPGTVGIFFWQHYHNFVWNQVIDNNCQLFNSRGMTSHEIDTINFTGSKTDRDHRIKIYDEVIQLIRGVCGIARERFFGFQEEDDAALSWRFKADI